MSDISVVLSTTKNIIKANLSSEVLAEVRESNVPMCIAALGMSLFGFGNSLEKEELNFARICLGMCKTVDINVKKRSVFIGEKPSESTTGLIVYEDDIRNNQSDDFFTQWEKTHCLLIEYQVNDPSRKDSIFCIKGFWVEDSWKYLDIFPGGNVQIIPERGDDHGLES